MTTKEWTKEWAAEAERTSAGTFTPRGDEPMGKSNSIRFPESVQEWLEAEAERRDIRLAEMVRLCVVEKMHRMGA